MSVIKKVVTLLRSSVREIGDSMVDANAQRIYEQEILDAKHSIEQAKADLVGVMAQEMQSARDLDRLKRDIQRYESLAVEALNKDQEALAEEVAARVGSLEHELDEQTRAHASYAVQVLHLKDAIKASEARIREHEREIAIAQTTESVYRATRSISDNIGSGGSKLINAKESLQRIKRRHEALSDRMTAAEQLDAEFSHVALDRKLAAAGIGPEQDRTRIVMERIRLQHARPLQVTLEGD